MRYWSLIIVFGLATTILPVAHADDSFDNVKIAIALDSSAESVKQALVARPELVKASDEFGATLLEVAVDAGRLEIAQMLVGMGAREDIFTAAGMGDTGFVRAALAATPDAVEGRGRTDETPLRWAARWGQGEVAELLIARGGKHDVFTAAALGDAEALSQMLHERPRLVFEEERHGEAPLHWASRTGKPRTAALLLDAGALVNAKDQRGRTPLHLAVARGRSTLAGLLLERGADPNVISADVVPVGEALVFMPGGPLHLAVMLGKEDMVRLLLAHGADVNKWDISGQTPLHYAVRGHPDLADLLLRGGANVDTLTGHGFTPLILACDAGDSKSALLLLSRGAKVSTDGPTGLDGAADNGLGDVVVALLAHGANPNIVSGWGWTPLLLAGRKGHSVIVKELLRHGADPKARDAFDQMTALHWASGHGAEDIVSQLLDAGADVNAGAKFDWGTFLGLVDGGTAERADRLSRGRLNHLVQEQWEWVGEGRPHTFGRSGYRAKLGQDGKEVSPWTPLDQAAAAGRLGVVKILIARGARVNEQGKGISPLLCAVWAGHEDVVRALLAAGAGVAGKAANGATALHVAAATGDTKMAALLIASGADLGARDDSGLTPLRYAAEEGLGEMVNLLREKGANPDL